MRSKHLSTGGEKFPLTDIHRAMAAVSGYCSPIGAFQRYHVLTVTTAYNVAGYLAISVSCVPYLH